ncbi:MAG TPA: FmdB family zinc ribbon protein [Acidimicrobiales bacterium]|nr:FmdB family zinc ribbon protein [Acidimicrobiales bacterium]
MPTYEYACKSCGEHLEVVQSFRDDPLTTCPSCGGDLRKVFGSIGISFKGSGFYKTDSRPAAKSEGSSSSSSSSSSSDSKPSSSGASTGSGSGSSSGSSGTSGTSASAAAS